jgi:hypothetical protein
MSKFLAKWVAFLWLWVNGVKKSINGYCIRIFQPYIYAVYRYHCKFLTTTVLQLKDTISITRCDIYHLLNVGIRNSCIKMRILKSFRNPLLCPAELRAQGFLLMYILYFSGRYCKKIKRGM